MSAQKPVELGLSTDKILDIIEKAREWDVKVDVVDPQSGSNDTDDGDLSILEDFADDPTGLELQTLIDDLNEDEQIALVALMWVGRGTYSADEWEQALEDARRERVNSTSAYLLGTPQLADFLEDGLSELGILAESESLAR